MIPVDEFEEDKYFFFATRDGIVKRTPVAEFANIRSNGLIALTLRGDDELIGVKMTNGDENIAIGTRDGMLIKFNETDIRSMGRVAGGVRGIRLREGDIAVGMDIVSEGDEILVVTEKGFGKRTPEDEYRIQSRGGYGLKTLNVTERNGFTCCNENSRWYGRPYANYHSWDSDSYGYRRYFGHWTKYTRCTSDPTWEKMNLSRQSQKLKKKMRKITKSRKPTGEVSSEVDEDQTTLSTNDEDNES